VQVTGGIDEDEDDDGEHPRADVAQRDHDERLQRVPFVRLRCRVGGAAKSYGTKKHVFNSFEAAFVRMSRRTQSSGVSIDARVDDDGDDADDEIAEREILERRAVECRRRNANERSRLEANDNRLPTSFCD